MSEESSSTGDVKNVNKDVIEAVNLLAHGKRNILCGEISQAVTQLQDACRILAREFGELADECADSYLWYGKALLELFRMEGGVLGDAIPGTTESEDSENSADESSDQNSTNDNNEGEEDELEDGVMSEDLEEEETGESKDEISTAKDDENESNGTDALHDINVPSTRESQGQDTPDVIKDASNGTTVVNGNNAGSEESNRTGTEINPSVSQENEISDAVPGSSKQEATDTDDISNLQLAWEMLELSKLIYQRHDRADMKLKLAETYLKLGEIGMETEQYDQAMTDLSHCLSIQQHSLQADDRRLAETLYQMGLACTYSRKYDSAVAHYRSAMAVIQAKIDRLALVIAGEIPPDPTENGDGFYTPLELAEREIKELEALLPDILAKIDDVKDEQGEADKVKIMMQETVAPSTSNFGSRLHDGAAASGCFKSVSTVPEQPVNNISHLVRKKRKSEDDLTDKSDPEKRQKMSDGLASKSSSHESSRQLATSDNSEMPATVPDLTPEKIISTDTLSSQDESYQTEKANT